jgi:5S rRNA maturation endonuclease (ribonuclease M5)
MLQSGQMLMLKDEEKELLEFLHSIKRKTVIVEGKNDKRVLERIGFKNIITLNQGKSLYDTIEKVKGGVIILTDFDRKGNELSKKLKLFLRCIDCKVDALSRKRLKELFMKNKLTTIQSLKKLIKRGDVHGETCTISSKIHNYRKIRS